MDVYIEAKIYLVVRLSREANEPNVDIKRDKIVATAISDVFKYNEKHDGNYYLHYVAYITSLRLGYSLRPLNASVMDKLIKQGCAVTKIIYA